MLFSYERRIYLQKNFTEKIVNSSKKTFVFTIASLTVYCRQTCYLMLRIRMSQKRVISEKITDNNKL